MKIVKELGSGSFGRVYQLAATCDAAKDNFVSMKFMASQRTDSVTILETAPMAKSMHRWHRYSKILQICPNIDR